MPALLGYIGLGIISAPGALTYVVAVREMAPAIRAPVFALVQVALMGGQAAGRGAGRKPGRLDVGGHRRSPLWQLPTVAGRGLGAGRVTRRAAPVRPSHAQRLESSLGEPAPRHRGLLDPCDRLHHRQNRPASRAPRAPERPALPTKN